MVSAPRHQLSHQRSLSLDPPSLPSMPKCDKKKKPEILHSAGYWKDFHAARAARGTRIAPPNWSAPFQHPLSEAEIITTFVPGRSQPVVRIANAPGPRVADSTTISAGTTRAKMAYQPTRGTNSILACRERDDEKLLAALAASRARAPEAGGSRGAAVSHSLNAAGSATPDAAAANALRQLVRGHAKAHVAMARKGLLGEPATAFVAMSDNEVKAWLKSPVGREKVEAAAAAGRAARERALAGGSL
ncbi:hypothetical protein B0H11DRAFT_2230479 [Mycena galericulata]|nr:hypothetical protein B0H11DRAFT_2230479 [Mycena galericulata]